MYHKMLVRGGTWYGVYGNSLYYLCKFLVNLLFLVKLFQNKILFKNKLKNIKVLEEGSDGYRQGDRDTITSIPPAKYS